MEELKPCPFCGGEPEIWEGQNEDGNKVFVVWCCTGLHHVNTLPYVMPEQAIRAWNTRHERITKATYDHRGLWTCCSCGHNRLTDIEPNYCPNCGAKAVE